MNGYQCILESCKTRKEDIIADAGNKINNVFTSCWENVGKIFETEKSNVIPFPKRTSAKGE